MIILDRIIETSNNSTRRMARNSNNGGGALSEEAVSSSSNGTPRLFDWDLPLEEDGDKSAIDAGGPTGGGGSASAGADSFEPVPFSVADAVAGGDDEDDNIFQTLAAASGGSGDIEGDRGESQSAPPRQSLSTQQELYENISQLPNRQNEDGDDASNCSSVGDSHHSPTGRDRISRKNKNKRSRGGRRTTDTHDNSTNNVVVQVQDSEDCIIEAENFSHSNPSKVALGPPMVSRRRKKPKGLPKRPLSSYHIFFQRERSKIMTEQQGYRDGGPGFEDLGSMIDKRWHSLSPSERKQYEDLAEQDAGRYRKQMERYNGTVDVDDDHRELDKGSLKSTKNTINCEERNVSTSSSSNSHGNVNVTSNPRQRSAAAVEVEAAIIESAAAAAPIPFHPRTGGGGMGMYLSEVTPTEKVPKSPTRGSGGERGNRRSQTVLPIHHMTRDRSQSPPSAAALQSFLPSARSFAPPPPHGRTYDSFAAEPPNGPSPASSDQAPSGPPPSISRMWSFPPAHHHVAQTNPAGPGSTQPQPSYHNHHQGVLRGPPLPPYAGRIGASPTPGAVPRSRGSASNAHGGPPHHRHYPPPPMADPSVLPIPPGMELVLPDRDGRDRNYKVRYTCFAMPRHAVQQFMENLSAGATMGMGAATNGTCNNNGGGGSGVVPPVTSPTPSYSARGAGRPSSLIPSGAMPLGSSTGGYLAPPPLPVGAAPRQHGERGSPHFPRLGRPYQGSWAT